MSEYYTLEQLIAMDDATLGMAVKKTFSLMLDPYTALGRQKIKRMIDMTGITKKGGRISPAVATVIGEATVTLIESILDYQTAQRAQQS